KLVVKGNGGHSWGAFGLANPHHALGNAIVHFSKAAWAYTSGDIPKTSFNVGRIGGGTSVNSIPFESWMEVDMRAIDPKNL
ncbi:peptidase dimerization domain-containing protein, partial [Winogradskyella poriferorum]